MINKLIDDIIDLVNEQRDSQGMITKVNLKDEIKTLLELNFKNNCVLDDVNGCQHRIIEKRADGEGGYMLYCNECYSYVK